MAGVEGRAVTVAFSDKADAEAVLTHWMYNDGATVRAGAVIAEAMTDKVTVEVEAPIEGVLRQLVPENGVFRPGEPVAEILPPGTVWSPTPPPAQTAAPESEREAAFIPVMPAVRRYAEERGVDLAAVARRFPNKRLTRADIDAFAAEQSASGPALLPYPRERQVLIRNLTNPGALPFTLHRRLSVPEGTRAVGVQAALAWALSQLLPAHPRLFGRLRAEGFEPATELVLAVAVQTDRGLMAPVIEGSACRTVADWRERIEEIAENVRRGHLQGLRFGEPTFALTNLGPWGIEYFTPVLLPPAVAILGIGALEENRLPVSLTVDHRWVDGVDGAHLLQDLEGRLGTLPV
ncbi:MAG: 2-oxo acid dehydrogenase subunit E2 [Firmicutes bacterium]|nr:2-oxo acid dehydrogenase subunit E2 [Bacillota bacterium]